MAARSARPDGPPGYVRIIGGNWRGRRVAVRSSAELRPTTDRIRETLFNWLQGRLAGGKVADLFAGTGILGLEALSRGARSVSFVEEDRSLADALKSRLAELDDGRGRVVCADAYEWLAAAVARPLDLVFLDPPYSHGAHSQLCTLLLERGWLAPGAFVYVEHERNSPPELPSGLTVWREKTAGRVRFALLRAGPAATAGGER